MRAELQLRPVQTTESVDCLTTEVPNFPFGSPPPARALSEALSAQYDFEADLSIFCPEFLITGLRQDEARFRERHAEWFERAWFLHGHIRRAPSGELWAMITRILKARNLEIVSAAGFEFSPETWMNQRAEAERAGEILLGWVHSHSMHHLARVTRAGREQLAAPEFSRDGRDPLKQNSTHNRGSSSGLFLSTQDVESANRFGFSAAYQVTCVLDSDACIRPEAGLGEVLGVWGWYEGSLCRRGIDIVKRSQA